MIKGKAGRTQEFLSMTVKANSKSSDQDVALALGAAQNARRPHTLTGARRPSATEWPLQGVQLLHLSLPDTQPHPETQFMFPKV